jgi:hypothetical protein
MRWRNHKNLVGRRGFAPRRGFTLVEAALTTMIVGLGTVAMMGLLTTGTNSNQTAANLTVAINLADDIHELCDRLPFAKPGASPAWGIPSGATLSQLMVNGTVNANGDITWLDGQTFGANSSPAGPVDGTFSTIPGMSGWTQAVAVNSVSMTNITTNVTYSLVNNQMSRVTVTISHDGQQIYQTSWIVAK